jgi:lysozyme family protein
MLAVKTPMHYNRGHKGRKVMAVFGGWRITRAGVLFIVGILVLGGLVTGGIFLVKNHGEAVRHDQAVKIAEQNLKDQSQTSTQPVTTDTSSNSDQTNTATTDSNSTTNTDTSTATTGTDATTLPETGVDGLQVLGQTVIIAIVALSVAYYVSSRRALRAR